MVEFLPFKGLIPQLSGDEIISDRVSPPYDVIEEVELKRLQGSPHNITRITLGSRDGNYDGPAASFRSWISEGRLKEDPRDCFYLLRQTFARDGRQMVRTGIMGALRIEPYEAGSISPHEETFPKVKEDRLNLLRATEAHLESIFCLYDEIDQTIMAEALGKAEMLFSYKDQDGTEHAFGRISDGASIKELRSALAHKKLLIADGHHRYETALRYSQEHGSDERKGYVLATLVAGNDPGLAVMPTHRIFKGIEISMDEFLFHASKFFAIWEVKSLGEVVRLISLNKRTSLGVLFPGGQMFVFELAWRPTDDPLWSVDAYVCEELLLKKILQKKGEVKVDYDHDATSAAKKVDAEGAALAVILSPPKLDVIWTVAKEGEKMPRKSTYFYPKVWSGFVALDMR